MTGAGLATAPKLTRTARFAKEHKIRAVNFADADAVRARRATANRVLAILKAALNHSFHDGHVASDEVWRKVKPFREADAPVIRYLTRDECWRLVNACEGAFRDLVRAALLTGCRYGELIRMRGGDFDAGAGTVTIRESKGGQPRHVALTSEGQEFFVELTAGSIVHDLIFTRQDGKPWGPSNQQRPLREASARAKIEPAVSFHILRHSYASTLAVGGCPMSVISAQLGHADVRVSQRHYAHLAPNYVAEAVRVAFPVLGIVDITNVTTLASRRQQQ